jgi:hypothetical protein
MKQLGGLFRQRTCWRGCVLHSQSLIIRLTNTIQCGQNPVKPDVVECVKKHSVVLLMDYPVTAGTSTERALEA